MTAMMTEAGPRVALSLDEWGIPHATVTAGGDVTLSALETAASQALAADRLAQLKRPFPGRLILVGTDETEAGEYATTFRAGRLL